MSSNARQAVQLAISHLAKQGHRRIGIWIPTTPRRPKGTEAETQRRLSEFKQMFEEDGCEYNPNFIWYGDTESTGNDESHQEQGFRAARQLFCQPREQWPDAIYIGDDMMTHGALIALDQLGAKVDDDIAIATQANRGGAILQGREKLILLEDDPTALVDTLFDVVERLMNGLEVEEKHICISPSLRVD